MSNFDKCKNIYDRYCSMTTSYKEINNMKKCFQKLSVLGLAILVIMSLSISTVFAAENAKAYRTDFYQAVNEDWLSKAVIPDSRYKTSEMENIFLLVKNQLMNDLNAICTGKKPIPSDIPGFKNFLQYYILSMDFASREKQGVAPMLPALKRIETLKSVDQLMDLLPEWTLDRMPAPINYEVFVDFKQTSKYSLYLGLSSSILPDSSYYDENKEVGDQLLAVYKDSVTKMAMMAGKTKSQASAIAKEAVEYDRLLLPFLPTSLEQNDFTAMYNPVSYQEVSSVNKKLAAAGEKLVGTKLTRIILTNKNGLKGISVALAPKNFQKMKSWMYAQTLMNYKEYLTESYRQIGGQFTKAMSAINELPKKEEIAHRNAITLYEDPVGIYYGKTYLGEKGKAEVTNMVKEFIATYRELLENNTWMGKATRANAIKKLDNLDVQIGYPDSVQPIFTKMTVVSNKKGGTFVSNTLAINRKKQEYIFDQYKNPFDKSSFTMSGFTVNAAYDPFSNSICVPAAFLQGAIYSTKQSASANYGGIGVVIAHEISHAFDPNGSKFDENGNMSNWWTEKDHKKFSELSQRMVDQFDGVPFAGGKVNGTLTLSENIADLGGISCALSVAKSKADFDSKAFFKNFAIIWREKTRPEMANMSLLTDPHSPAKLRVNLQLPNFEEFYQAFSVKPGDPMYRAPKDRVSIW